MITNINGPLSLTVPLFIFIRQLITYSILLWYLDISNIWNMNDKYGGCIAASEFVKGEHNSYNPYLVMIGRCVCFSRIKKKLWWHCHYCIVFVVILMNMYQNDKYSNIEMFFQPTCYVDLKKCFCSFRPFVLLDIQDLLGTTIYFEHRILHRWWWAGVWKVNLILICIGFSTVSWRSRESKISLRHRCIFPLQILCWFWTA